MSWLDERKRSADLARVTFLRSDNALVTSGCTVLTRTLAPGSSAILKLFRNGVLDIEAMDRTKYHDRRLLLSE
jgi:hypothetical protein